MKTLGVNDIAYTEVDSNFIFEGQQILYKNAIVITMEMKKSKIDLAPSDITNREIFRTYYELGVDVNKGAKLLRKFGFNVQAGPAIGGAVNYVLLARAAGLGEIGKHGLLINDKFGPSLRIAAIYTDIENLPINNKNTYSWISDFCQKCQLCVKACPGKAIYKTPLVFENNTQQHIDYNKCAVPFSNQHGCTICVKSCTFYKQDYYKLKEKFTING